MDPELGKQGKVVEEKDQPKNMEQKHTGNEAADIPKKEHCPVSTEAVEGLLKTAVHDYVPGKQREAAVQLQGILENATRENSEIPKKEHCPVSTEAVEGLLKTAVHDYVPGKQREAAVQLQGILENATRENSEMTDGGDDPSVPDADGICHIKRLPDELLYAILKKRITRFSYSSDLKNYGHTCTKFREIVRSKMFWIGYNELVLQVYASGRCILNSEYYGQNFVVVLRRLLEHEVQITKIKFESQHEGMTDKELFRLCVLLASYKERFDLRSLNVAVTKVESLGKILSCIQVGVKCGNVDFLRISTDTLGNNAFAWQFMKQRPKLTSLALEVGYFDGSSVRELVKNIKQMASLEHLSLTNYTGGENYSEKRLEAYTTLNELLQEAVNLKSLRLMRQHLMNSNIGRRIADGASMFKHKFEGNLETLIVHVEPMWFRPGTRLHTACSRITWTFPKLVNLRLVSHVFQNPLNDVHCVSTMIEKIVQDMSNTKKPEFALQFMFDDAYVQGLMIQISRMFEKIEVGAKGEFICDFGQSRLIIWANFVDAPLGYM